MTMPRSPMTKDYTGKVASMTCDANFFQPILFIYNYITLHFI